MIKNIFKKPLGTASMLVVTSFFVLSEFTVSARPVMEQPTNWIVVRPSNFIDKTEEINTALEKIRDNGGGTVYLMPGTYIVSDSLKVETTIDDNGYQKNPFHVRLLGATPVTSHGDGDTIIKWVGKDSSKAVIEVTHSANTTIENLRIEAGLNKRFRYGIFFHRTDSAADGTATLMAPGGLNIIDSGISKGNGSFTVGVRLQDSGPNAEYDQNCDHNYIENLYIDGATDDNGGTRDNLLDGLNSSGILIDGSQVQGNYFHNVNVNNSGTGVFLLNGQLQIFGGKFTNNIQPPKSPSQCMADDNHASIGGKNGVGGGDFVFRTGYAAGQVIQDIESEGSYRFFSSFMEDAGSWPHSGDVNKWQSAMPVAVAIVHCSIKSTAQIDGNVVMSLGNGGPLVFNACTFGDPNTIPQKIVLGQWSQGSVVVTNSKFNHNKGPFYDIPYDGDTNGEPSKVLLANNSGYSSDLNDYASLENMATDPNDLYLLPFMDEDVASYISPKSLSDHPLPVTAHVFNVARPFEWNGVKYEIYGNMEDVDNAPAINAAIEKAKTESPDGSATIWFPSGGYVVKTPILLSETSKIKLQGVGGRYAMVSNGVDPIKGSAFIWAGDADGEMLVIEGSQNIAVEGLFFSTYYGENDDGPNKMDTAIAIRDGASTTENIWLQDIGGQFLAGDEVSVDNGPFNSFVHIGDGSENQFLNHITMLGITTVRAAEQGILVDASSATDVQAILYLVPLSKRGLRVKSGAFAWIGGAAGNTLKSFEAYDSLYTDPVVVELDNPTGPVYLVGRELQDNNPQRSLRTASTALDSKLHKGAGYVYNYGDNHLFFSNPVDRELIQFNWIKTDASNPKLYIYGSGIGTISSSSPHENEMVPVKVAVKGGGSAYSVGNFVSSAGMDRAWVSDESSFIQDVGSRSMVADLLSKWPYNFRNWKLYRSDIGYHKLEPLTVSINSQFNVSWSGADGDTDRTGDWVGLYAFPGDADDDFIDSLQLVDENGYYPLSGTTTESMLAPDLEGIYELRYFKNDTKRSVWYQTLFVE